MQLWELPNTAWRARNRCPLSQPYWLPWGCCLACSCGPGPMSSCSQSTKGNPKAKLHYGPGVVLERCAICNGLCWKYCREEKAPKHPSVHPQVPEKFQSTKIHSRDCLTVAVQCQPPEYAKKICPHCWAYSRSAWYQLCVVSHRKGRAPAVRACLQVSPVIVTPCPFCHHPTNCSDGVRGLNDLLDILWLCIHVVGRAFPHILGNWKQSISLFHRVLKPPMAGCHVCPWIWSCPFRGRTCPSPFRGLFLWDANSSQCGKVVC